MILNGAILKKIVFLSGVIAFFTFGLALASQELPQPHGYINDFAGVISQDYKDKISLLISSLGEKSGFEIAIITVNSIFPYDEKEYARLIFDKWKPGKKGKDSGVLILLALKEKSWRIETGYGVEGILTDAVCSGIGRNVMVPYFKKDQYSEGMYQGVLAIINILTDPDAQKRPIDNFIEKYQPVIILLIIAIIFILGAIKRKFGGPFSGGTGGFGGYYGGGGGGGGGSGGKF